MLGHGKYVDGTPKSHLRGIVHLTMFITYLHMMPIVDCGMVLYTWGKMVSYMASVALHCYPYNTTSSFKNMMIIDYCMISISITTSGITFMPSNWIRWYPSVMAIMTLASIMLAVSGNPLVMDMKNLMRASVLVLQSMLAGLSIGQADGWTCRSWMMISLYSLGYLFYGMKLTSRKPLLHHGKKWGYHEDFHIMTVIADVIPLMMVKPPG